MDRRVTGIKRDRSGAIVALCNPGESWSPRKTADIVKDIRNSRRSYYVEEAPRRTYVRVLAGNALQTTPDKTNKNHLDLLPVS